MKSIESNFNEIEKGEYIGKYVAPTPKVAYSYNQEIHPNLTRGIYIPLSFDGRRGAKSVNISKEELLHGKRRTNFNREKISVFDGQYRSPVYKPHPYEIKKINPNEFSGPFEQSRNPMIEKIIVGDKRIYFGIVNNKLVTYSVSPNKKIEVRSVKKLSQKPDRKFLKKYAIRTLEKIRYYEKLKTEYNKENIVPVYYPKAKESHRNLRIAVWV